MKKSNKSNRRRRSILCWILSAVVMTAGIPVQAAMFDSVPYAGDIFSSGADGDVFTDNGGTAPNESVTPEPSPSVSPEPTPSVSPEPTPSVSPEPTPSVSPEPTPSVSPEPTPSVSPEPTITPVPTPTVIPDGTVVIKFADSTGKYYEELEQAVKWGESLKLPKVPGVTIKEGNIWKLEKDKAVENTFSFAAEEELTLLESENWGKYMKDGVLTFYAAKKCKITLYNNSGTAAFTQGHLEAYEGETVILHDIPSSKYVNYGWTSVKGGRTVQFELNSKYKVTDDLNLYIIRYTAEKVTFLQSGGTSTSAMERLNLTVGKYSTITIPEVPRKTGYEGLGWSRTPRDTSPDYTPGKTLKITKDIKLYAVCKRLPYTVTFNNNKGNSTSRVYSSLKMYAKKYQVVTLPELPKASGYQNIGWTTERGKTSPVYKPGTRIKIKKSMQFYTVRRRSNYYTVQFYLGNGATSSAYQRLNMKVEEGTTITFPKVPARDGYINKGWSYKKNATTATSKTTYTVKKNLKFYAVQVKTAKIVLHYVNGNVFSTTTLAEGASYTLPCVKNAQGYTFMGWSDRPNQSTNPLYEPEMKVTAKGTMNLYAVVFKRSNEENIPASGLPQMDIFKYKRVVFVGDSRTVFMKNALKSEGAQSGIDVTNGIEFICEVGKGLDWFKTTGYQQLFNIVKNDSNSFLSKPTAVIFNLGVNDLSNCSSYVLYLNSIAPLLESKGCKLYYMSVNPVNRSMLKVNGKKDRSEAELRNFNSTIRTALAGSYKFIDTYSFLKSTGYGFDNGNGSVGSTGIDDGLHYTSSTYKRIYKYCMNVLKTS